MVRVVNARNRVPLQCARSQPVDSVESDVIELLATIRAVDNERAPRYLV